MAGEKILVVDDEAEFRDLLTFCFENEAMQVTSLEEGRQVIATLQANHFDLVVLDLMLRDADGFDILKQIRKLWPNLPVLIISARGEEDKKVVGFALEADDYLTKPFSRVELIARAKRHMQRSRSAAPEQAREPESPAYCLACADLKLDLKSCLLYKKDKQIPLQARLFKLLKFFMEHQDQVFSKEQIYNQCWDDNYFDENTVQVYIRKLRMLIEDHPDTPEYLHTVIGLGYRFCRNLG